MARKLQTVILCIIINSLWVEASSPVVLWSLKRIGEASVESNLNEFSSQQFADLLAWKSEQGNIPVIAFGLNTLSLEDLTAQGGIDSSEPFRKLRRITDGSAETLLFPAVQSAADSISVLQRKGYQVYQVSAGDVLPKLDSSNSILVISEKSGVDMDDEVLRAFSKYTLDFPNLVGMLWGKRSTWTEEPDEEVNEILSRKKRQAPAPAPAPEPSQLFQFNDEKGLFMVFRSVILTVAHGNTKNSTKFTTATASTSEGNGTHATVLNLKFPNSNAKVVTSLFDLSMTLVKSPLGYWRVNGSRVRLEGNLEKPFKFDDVRLGSTMDINIHGTKSFHCSRFGSLYPNPLESDKVAPQNHTFTIQFTGFQIQAFMASTESKFAEVYECVGFFTPGIWSGIFMTIILLSILTWGLKMIMDVKTMDRFDDPKGKPISFGGSE